MSKRKRHPVEQAILDEARLYREMKNNPELSDRVYYYGKMRGLYHALKIIQGYRRRKSNAQP